MLSTNLLLVYHICDEILSGKIESNLSCIPSHLDQYRSIQLQVECHYVCPNYIIQVLLY